MAEEFTCDVDEKYRSACKDLPKYSGSRYCVLHEPDEAKNKEDFEEAKKSKLAREDYDFSGTVFPEDTSAFRRFVFDGNADFTGTTFVGEANFSGAKFCGERTDFSEAQFSGERTYFSKAKFSSSEWTDFSVAQFTGRTYFSEAHFSGESTGFSEAHFSGERTDFSEARFSGERTKFTEAHFSGERTDFSVAQFSSSEWTSFTRVQFSGKETSFSEAQFSSSEATDFSRAKFSGEATSFSEAHFSGERTDFSVAQFSSSEVTDFSKAQFSSSEWTSFLGARFRGGLTIFNHAKFSSSKGTSFTLVRFGSAETYFAYATFTQEVAFNLATFRAKASFWGSKVNPVFGSGAWARFGRCRIEKPEQFTFDTVLLHPGFFCNTDVRKVDFTDVKWYGMPGGPEGTLDEEIEALRKRDLESPHTLLAQACRRLSANAEENHEYPLANEFHNWSMDALRIGSWSVIYEALLKEEVQQHINEAEKRDIKFKDLKPKALDVRALLRKDARDHIRGRRRFGVVNSLYWGLSGYGVKAGRALGVLVTIAVVFAVLYMIVGHASLRVLPIEGIWQVLADAGRAMMYSLGVMARLRPEPIPKQMGLFQILVTVEGILGPLQIALLALAIRRKVMR